MNEKQLNEAIDQMKVQCDLKMATYEPASARAVLHELGYDGDDVEQVLQRIYDGGFTYCLDSRFEATHYDPDNPRAVGGMVTDRPSADACYWGPDQLKSRLDSLFYPTPPREGAYRVEIRSTLRSLSDEALRYQDGIVRGGIDREEIDAEIARRAREHPSPERCAICGEPVVDDAAEMYDASKLDDPELYSEAEAGIVHGECGVAAGWEVA